MRTKNFYLCLLLLVLGTAKVWADKYYQPWDYRYEDPRFSTLADMVGEKFMIYNTSFNGEEDRTGFLYDNGTKVTLDKTKERDRFVYNEKFVYILEEYGTADDGAYAFKSVGSGTYVAADGSTGYATPQPIYIKDWEAAKTAGWAREGVRCENEDFEGVDNANITNAGCKVFLISSSATHVADEKNYWNGNYNSFALWQAGHPFAFYKVREVQSGAYLQDLHIFSRSDIYSAQVIWGYVKTDDDITGAAETSLLIDGDLATSVTATDYLQFDLGEAASSIYVYLQRSSADGAVIPANINIQASANGTDGWQDVTTLATNLGSKISYTSGIIQLGGDYQHIRVVNASGEVLALSEAYILPTDKKMQDAVGYFSELAKADNLVYTRASAQQYASLVEEYNALYPEAKTLSGVPLPGNKYRIYADAYDIDNQVYVNKEIYWTGKDANGDNILTMSVADQGSYHDDTEEGTDARKAYEWYCEETNDGYLVFRNVANTGLYLANNGTVSATAYKWSFSTVQTHHFGVPMWDGQGKYLAVANDGSDGNNGWVPDVAAAQDQVNSADYAYQTEGAATPDDTSDDEYVTVEKGVCTDFVFIPVDITAEEKKITFTTNEIAKRNSVFKFDGVTYSLPYSRMFTSEDELDKATFTLLCPEVHTYVGTYVNNSEDADDTGKVGSTDNIVYTFDYNKITDGDVLDIKLTFKPFDTCSDGSKLYLIRSLRNQSIAQQAPGMRKADIEIGDDGEEGPIQTAGANVYYARFEGRDKKMSLVPASKTAAVTTFDAASLFYFQPTEDTETGEYYSVSIRSAITPYMCAYTNKWTETGDTWYVQPNEASGMVGYAMGLNVLNATNNPGDAWCTNHSDGDSIVSYNVEDAGAVWEFIPVTNEDNAKTMLQNYILTKGAEVEADITDMMGEQGIDDAKAGKYITYVQGIVTNSQNDAITVAQLVDLSQKVHMLEHELVYALQELPTVTLREEIGKDNNYVAPHWYYIYNVRSKYAADGTTEQAEHYAKFVGNNEHMALEQITDADADGDKDFGLANMFYFEGKKVTEEIGEGTYNKVADNALSIDEYLQVDVHNFMVPDTTLVSKNKVVYTSSDNNPDGFHPGGDGWAGEATIVSGLNLQYNDTWRIECEYDFSGDKFESFNTYGSCLLSSTEPGLTWYNSEFQVYLQDDREIVVKLNNGYDTHKWDGTVDYYTNIRIVITHSPAATTFDIYNSIGEKWTVSFTKASLNTVTQLKTMLPGNGVKIKILAIEEVKAHNWKVQDLSAGDPTTVDTANEEDTWYILPSSNTSYTGFSIVAKGANDSNLGWTNVTASNNEIFSDAGNADNSTWQFVRIKEFDDHADQILAMCDIRECVIYNRELKELYLAIVDNVNRIHDLAGTAEEESLFNEVYALLIEYKKKSAILADDLKAPKVGKIYTVRYVDDEDNDKGLAVHVDGTTDGGCATREVYSADITYGDTHTGRSGQDDVTTRGNDYTSRGAWVFEGTDADGDGFYDLDQPIYVKNLHTQCYLASFGDDATLVEEVESKSAITLSPKGSCTAGFQSGGDYMNMGTAAAETDLPVVTYTQSFDGYEEVTSVPAAVQEVIDNNQLTGTGWKVYCRKVDIADLTENGKITARFEYTAGNHKLNILAVVLEKEDGTVVKGDYHWGTVGGSFNNHIYQLQDVAATGSYKLCCYVLHDGKDGDDVNQSAGNITITTEGFNRVNGTGTEETAWIIEEVPEYTKIFHSATTNSVGLGSLMLGFDAAIPVGVYAFYPKENNDVTDKHVTLKSYEGVLPACTPAILHKETVGTMGTFKFYYTTQQPQEVTDMATAKGDGIAIDGSLYKKIVDIAPYDKLIGEEVNVYMYLSDKTKPKLYRVYKNYNAYGTKTGNNHNGGHVNVNANRAFLVIGGSRFTSNSATANSSLSLGFDGGWTTDIDQIEDDYEMPQDNAVKGIFDLQGRRLSEITAPGVYIIDGEKVLVK